MPDTAPTAAPSSAVPAKPPRLHLLAGVVIAYVTTLPTAPASALQPTAPGSAAAPAVSAVTVASQPRKTAVLATKDTMAAACCCTNWVAVLTAYLTAWNVDVTTVVAA